MSPYRLDECVCEGLDSEGACYAYLYDTLAMKLRAWIPFSNFEFIVLRNSKHRPYSTPFEQLGLHSILCEELGQSPSLNVFVWFFLADKQRNLVGLCLVTGLVMSYSNHFVRATNFSRGIKESQVKMSLTANSKIEKQ
ncbi:hypothetical protein CR513_61734, partial [Mucuna pruriens]